MPGGKCGNYYVAKQISKICPFFTSSMLPLTQLNQSVVVSLILFNFYAFRWQENLSNSTNARKSLRCPRLTLSMSKPSSHSHQLIHFTSDMVYHTLLYSFPLCTLDTDTDTGEDELSMLPRAFVCGLPVGISPC